MEVLMILLAIAVVVAAFLACVAFNEHCVEKFNYAFFTKQTCAVVAFCSACVWLALYIHKPPEDLSLNSIVLIILGVVSFLGYAVYNCKKTNFWYGIFGSLLQLIIFVPIVCTVAVIILYFIALSLSSPGRRRRSR